MYGRSGARSLETYRYSSTLRQLATTSPRVLEYQYSKYTTRVGSVLLIGIAQVYHIHVPVCVQLSQVGLEISLAVT